MKNESIAALKGTEIIGKDGKRICTVARDVLMHEGLCVDQFTDWAEGMKPRNDDKIDRDFVQSVLNATGRTLGVWY